MFGDIGRLLLVVCVGALVLMGVVSSGACLCVYAWVFAGFLDSISLVMMGL